MLESGRYRIRLRIEIEVVRAWRFDWDEGEGIPDIPGIKYAEWQDVEVAPGLVKAAPVVETAYILAKRGSSSIRRGEWLIESQEGDLYVLGDSLFRMSYERVEDDAVGGQDR